MALGIPAGELISFLVAVSFAAGLNIYATAGTLGILGRVGWVGLPQVLEGLTHTWVIAAASALFALEFVADKIPYVDLVWNAAHTFVRIPLAALMAYKATSGLTPGMQLLATAMGAGIAAVAHTSKTAARTAVSVSPEPVSNIALSSAEDAGAIGLTWVATHHPVAAAVVAGVLVVGAGVMVRWIVQGVKRQVGRVRERFGSGRMLEG